MSRTLPPVRIGEVVLKTARFDAMKRWWQTALGVDAYLENERFSFRRVFSEYPYTQVIAIFNRPELAGVEAGAGAGMDHVQFRHGSLGALLDRYEALRDAGITPHRSMNHGPATSFYYRDPDANVVEFSATNFSTEAEYLRYVSSDAFRQNISGVAIDPDDFVARYRGGTPQADLVRIA